MAIEFGSRKETFENFKVYETTLAGRPFKVEMGKMCGLSNASALIRYGETCVLCNVVMSPKPREGVDFFPLNVEYEEKLYAAGRIPGSFMRREGRPGERAILTSRVVDRPMRPLFPKEMRNDVCITMTVMSLDPDCSPEIAGMIGASLVTAVSEIPWNGPIGGVQVGLVDGEIVLNPTQEQRKVSDLALTVAATMDKIVMIEAGANEVDEDTMLNAIKAAHVEIKKIITFINGIVAERGKPKIDFQVVGLDMDVFHAIQNKYLDDFKAAMDTDDKNVREARVGDTITLADRPAAEPLPGYRAVQPMVFCGVYPADGAHYADLRDALEKLQLNDAALTFEPETSVALGFGFRCGFLGLLHMEIIQERLEREYNLDLITTAPSVVYHITKTDGTKLSIDNPTNYPDPSHIALAEEPIANAHIYSPTEFVGNIMELCQDRRGIFKDMKYIDTDRVDIHYELPLNEIIYDFFDALKSRTRGYASFDYELIGYRKSELVKLDIMLNGEPVDALSTLIHFDNAYDMGRRMCEKLKELIPRQQFEIAIQAAIGAKIIARETIKAVRKDVTAKCYGGDVSRKRKLLEKQKEGKKRMRQVGNVEIPQSAFMSVLKLDEN